MKNFTYSLLLCFFLPTLLPAQIIYSGGDGDGGAVDTYTSAVAFPLTLLSFTATPTEKEVTLHWQTEDEVDTDIFLLQRSPDATDFITIATLPAAGHARGQRLNYSHTDPTPLPGSNYYRLTTRDFDGSITRSPHRTGAYGRCAGTRLLPLPQSGGARATALRSYYHGGGLPLRFSFSTQAGRQRPAKHYGQDQYGFPTRRCLFVTSQPLPRRPRLPTSHHYRLSPGRGRRCKASQKRSQAHGSVPVKQQIDHRLR